ncbi:VOC family protein [Azospirillum canadense]|uniref:VOC family protein n=1 Tax=Azospirillum canadense TaxID=403962 RepID=UPI00222699EF|nr:VOC family protein [Azospirillum canadense]MCW2238804.1 catechol 2,3-dioxygenase-like lactoylglutathione lyase family enzyme [Azospirillum canadense]
MGIAKLAHYSIRTTDLEASRRFYTEVMGFRAGFRPPFDFPGLWLYQGEDESEFGVVHIIGVDPNDPSGLHRYLGDRPAGAQEGTGTVDHIAFLANGWAEMRGRLDRIGVAFRERTVPSLGLHQVFLEDPSGVTIELNYPAAEAGQG